MSKIVGLWPASSSFPAIGWPMLPTPRYPASITLPPSRRLRRQFTSQTQEFRVEHLCRHYLAAADQPDLVRAVTGKRPVQRAEMVPDQRIILGPHISPAKLRLELVREQVFKRLVALAPRQFVDPLGEARVAVEHLPAGDRVGQEDWVNDGRTAAALVVGHWRARAVVDSPHMLPEFLDVVRRGHAIEPRLDLGRQRLIGGVHVGKLGAAQRLAVAVRDADAVEHVHKARHLAIGHVGMPVLPGIRAADVSAVLLEVRKDIDLGIFLRLGTTARGRALDLAELLRKALQLAEPELLIGKTQYPMPSKRQ